MSIVVKSDNSSDELRVDPTSKAARVTLYDAAGAVISSFASTQVDPTTSGSIAAISQSVALTLTGQSSGTIQIGGTWVGTLQFEGTLDGTTWGSINATIASTNLPATTGTANGLYRLTPGGLQQFRVTATAWTSGTATILIRASNGTSAIFSNQLLPIAAFDRDLSLASGLTSLRDLLVAQRATVYSDSLADGISTTWIQTTASGGTITASGGEGLIQTSANATGSAQIVGQTVDYFPGQVAWLNSAIRLGDTGSVGNIRRFGCYTVSGTTPQDGFFYELLDTTLNACYVNTGVITRVASTAWSKFSTAPFTLDGNFHGFEIRFTANSVFFYIDNVLRHSTSGTTTPLTATLNFPITISSINTSGATNRLIGVRNIGMGRFGTPPNVPHLTGYVNVHKDVEYTTAQTGTAIWTPNTGKKFVVTDYTISVGGTTAGIITLWQGASADTTYTAGTDPCLARLDLAPSATIKYAFNKSYRIPFVSTTVDHILRITTSAAVTVYIQIEGYEI